MKKHSTTIVTSCRERRSAFHTYLFFLLVLLFSSSASAETLILCSEYGAEGRRPSALEAWLDQPAKALKPNTCEQVLAKKISTDLLEEKLWAVGNAASVYRSKMLVDRVSADWMKAREVELEELAANFTPRPEHILVCTLRPIKSESIRDFRMQYVYQADCKWKKNGTDQEICSMSWTSKAVAEPKSTGAFDPVIEQIIQNGSLRLAKCMK